ncbi:hypothetical protein RvY_08585 [Ramazzottius varieornatus]|uniref:DDE Tnp4 domain-containing protein n=1 Tax=Ramazzottius varieornatus TaxID=947166 RepID=A0A1D1VFK0_RAMVA|nr:hypothetical protein RvY_08585 [Ramazzottius varieornatus]
MLDRTLVSLEYKPTKHGDDYWSHKSQYGISAMVVCDDKRKMRYMFIGFRGSAHDMRVDSNSSMARQVSKLFSPGEYLLADSAYTTTTHIIASYKKPAAGVMSPNNERFNFYHSSTRIKIEYTNGILQGRFPSLQSLRIKIHDKQTHRAAVEWTQACVVLHNMLLKDSYFDDNWTKYRESGIPEISHDAAVVDGKDF